MKKLVLLAVGAILFLGAIAAGAALLFAGRDVGGGSPGPQVQVPIQAK